MGRNACGAVRANPVPVPEAPEPPEKFRGRGSTGGPVRETHPRFQKPVEPADPSHVSPRCSEHSLPPAGSFSGCRSPSDGRGATGAGSCAAQDADATRPVGCRVGVTVTVLRWTRQPAVSVKFVGLALGAAAGGRKQVDQISGIRAEFFPPDVAWLLRGVALKEFKEFVATRHPNGASSNPRGTQKVPRQSDRTNAAPCSPWTVS